MKDHKLECPSCHGVLDVRESDWESQAKSCWRNCFLADADKKRR